ncbi:Tryparedoxin [Diplonema papillatum]|nr:Tryparedoxin [Diplonema papillatum]KAJ9443139.1 Tryparedoxin [Diplonema papillatum]KAJ9461317.1 Tryparedoxin [Diplonema papillatum]KAJ9461318.1 Tryparedoxin [Diplonema papillatum]
MSNPVTLLRNCPLVNSKAERVAAAEVFDDCRAVVLYLTASWCPPCRKFSPQLAAAVRGTSVKVVMLSADRSEDEFKAYLAQYPEFFAVQYTSEARQALQRMMGASMMPTAHVYNADTGAIVTTWARVAVTTNPKCAKQWESGSSGLLSFGVLRLLAVVSAVVLLAGSFLYYIVSPSASPLQSTHTVRSLSRDRPVRPPGDTNLER